MKSLIVCAVVLFHPYWEEGTNTLKAHTTTNAPSIEIEAWNEHGWVHVDWCEELGDTWIGIAHSPTQHFGKTNFVIYLHPESTTTQSIVEADTGFFRLDTHWNSKIYSLDVSGLNWED